MSSHLKFNGRQNSARTLKNLLPEFLAQRQVRQQQLTNSGVNKVSQHVWMREKTTMNATAESSSNRDLEEGGSSKQECYREEQDDDTTEEQQIDNDDDSTTSLQDKLSILMQSEKQFARKGIITVDPQQDYRATELKICSFQRPHMRAFHYSWICFCVAFMLWFAIAPLLPEVRTSLQLSDSDIWISNICAVSSNIVMRFVFGALSDQLGARINMGLVLVVTAIPTALTGLVQSLTGLCTLRFFIGIAGSAFVMCQHWSTSMFTKEIVGTANALVAGWGNAGGGLTQIIMGTVLFPLFRDVFFDDSENPSEAAWRTVCVVPAVVAIITGIVVVLTSDDCPLGNFKELKKEGILVETSATTSFRRGAWEINSWLLFLQYGACFGVELTMNNAAATYFHDEFGLSTETASAIASIFGFMNLFARGLGGYVSDKANKRFAMRGRLVVQLLFLLLEGACVFVFCTMKQLWAAILVLTVFSVFVQAAEGSTFGIVPYINPQASGAVAGIVGAGGPFGAMVFGFGFLYLSEDAYFLMGTAVICASLASLAINIRGHGGIFLGVSAKEQWRQSVILRVPDPVSDHDNDSSSNEEEEMGVVDEHGRSNDEEGTADKLSTIAEEEMSHE